MEISKVTVERFVWGFEKWISIAIIGSILMIVANLGEKYISDFYPWDFVAGGVWIGYCNWRGKIN